MEKKLEIFLCYARKDQPYLDQLKAHLTLLKRQEIIDLWYDAEIRPGAEWEKEISKHLSTAQIILLLVSPDFMLSDYCYSVEMKRAMERHECGEAIVIPIILRHVSWQKAPFGKLQVLPTNAIAINTWVDQDEAFSNVAEGIRKVVEELIFSFELAEEQARQREELAKEQAQQREELAKEQAQQREEQAKEQAKQQRELANEWLIQRRASAEKYFRQSGNDHSQEGLKRSWVVGIDLGTTNSCIATIECGKPVVIPNAEGSRTTPSVVAITNSGDYLVGEAAKQQAITNPENTVFSIKRFIGHKYDDLAVLQDKCLVPYEICCGDNNDPYVRIQGQLYSPIEIAARILQKLRLDAERYLGGSITKAVITVPAYFSGSQRQAVKDSASIAGLDILRIINEPTAASLAYGLYKKRYERIAVYDMGGGTFNISILELGDGIFEVRCTNGDMHLGGDDFNHRIVRWLAREFLKDSGIDLLQEHVALQRLKEAAERAKKELSTTIQTEINLPFIIADASGPKHLHMSLSRTKLEQLVKDLVEKSGEIVKKALSYAGLKPGDINAVILVGGQTRMPAIQSMVTHIFNRELYRGVSRDEVVAVGAAVEAGVLVGNVNEVFLLDVAPYSLCIETSDGFSIPLIERNTTIPTVKSCSFALDVSTNDMPSKLKKPTEYALPVLEAKHVEILILESGQYQSFNSPTILGSLIFDVTALKRPQIEVSFNVDKDGKTTVAVWNSKAQCMREETIVALVDHSKGKLLTSLGIKTLGGYFVPVVECSEILPVKKQKTFMLLSNNLLKQTFTIVDINILLGEHEVAKDNYLLGNIMLDNIPIAPTGVSQIEVTCNIDANGILNVEVHDMYTGRRQKTSVTASSSLAKHQIGRMIREAEKQALEDKNRIVTIEDHNSAEKLSYLAEKTIIELGDMLTREQRSKLSSHLIEVRISLSSNNMNRVRASCEALEQAFREISENVYLQLFPNETFQGDA